MTTQSSDPGVLRLQNARLGRDLEAANDLILRLESKIRLLNIENEDLKQALASERMKNKA